MSSAVSCVYLRLRYSKLGRIRFVSHRDGARLWERALRRVGLPVSYTQGFTPRPKLSFGLALPTGAESVAEYLDVELGERGALDPVGEEVRGQLCDALPEGMHVDAVALRDPAVGSLQESVTSSTWEMWSDDIDPDSLDTAIERLLAADELPIERERKGAVSIDDVRPLILDLRRDETRLVADLSTAGRALRPAELVATALPWVDTLGVRIMRTQQWISHDGERREVLPLPAVVSTHGEEPRA